MFMDPILFKVDFNLLFHSFKDIKFGYVPVIIFFMFSSLFLRAYKWKYLLIHFKKEIKIIYLVNSTLLGFMFNVFLPARLGEVIRAVYLGIKTKISKTTLFTTVIVERIFDGFVVLLMLSITFLKHPVVRNINTKKIGIIGSTGVIVIFAGLILFYYRKDFFMKILKKLPFKNFYQKIEKFMDNVYNGLHIFKKPKEFIIFTLYTIVTWILVGFQNHFLLKSMEMYKIIGNASVVYINIAVLSITTVGFGVPAAPGAAGTYQASVIFSLYVLNKSILNTPAYNKVVAFSLFSWLVIIIPQLIGGLLILLFEKDLYKRLSPEIKK